MFTARWNARDLMGQRSARSRADAAKRRETTTTFLLNTIIRYLCVLLNPNMCTHACSVVVGGGRRREDAPKRPGDDGPRSMVERADVAERDEFGDVF